MVDEAAKMFRGLCRCGPLTIFIFPLFFISSACPAVCSCWGDAGDLDIDGRYELYDGDIDVQCACIDGTYTTCFEYVSLSMPAAHRIY